MLFPTFIAIFAVTRVCEGQLIYTNSAIYKFIVGVSVPIDLMSPGRGLGWVVNLQGLYRGPDNITYFEPYKVVQRRSTSKHYDRKLVYNLFESYWNKNGLSGKDCLLQLICEAAKLNFGEYGEQQLLATFLRILFTPNAKDDLDESYGRSHDLGARVTEECYNYFNCTGIGIIT